MSKNKLARFRELPSFENVVNNPAEYKGRWKHDFFKNDNPITLELGCGKGEYSLELAQRLPKQNFIGLDLKVSSIFQLNQIR